LLQALSTDKDCLWRAVASVTEFDGYRAGGPCEFAGYHPG
jgi:hypothetical protein